MVDVSEQRNPRKRSPCFAQLTMPMPSLRALPSWAHPAPKISRPVIPVANSCRNTRLHSTKRTMLVSPCRAESSFYWPVFCQSSYECTRLSPVALSSRTSSICNHSQKLPKAFLPLDAQDIHPKATDRHTQNPRHPAFKPKKHQSMSREQIRNDSVSKKREQENGTTPNSQKRATPIHSRPHAPNLCLQ